MNDKNSDSKRIISHSIEAVLASKWYALEEYLNKMGKAIQEAEKRFHDKVNEELKKVSELTDEQKQGFYEYYAEINSHYTEEFPRILRNSFLATVISLLEFELGVICGRLKTEQAIEGDWRELKGNLLEKAKRFCKSARLNLTYDAQTWQNINNFYLVRNCIVHNNGFIQGFRYRDKLLPYITQKEITSQENEQEIALTEKFCREVIRIMMAFTDKVWDMVYNLPPKRIRHGD